MSECTVPDDALRCSLGHHGHTTTVCIIRITLGRVPKSNNNGKSNSNGGPNANAGSKRRHDADIDNDLRKKLMVIVEQAKSQNTEFKRLNRTFKQNIGKLSRSGGPTTGGYVNDGSGNGYQNNQSGYVNPANHGHGGHGGHGGNGSRNGGHGHGRNQRNYHRKN